MKKSSIILINFILIFFNIFIAIMVNSLLFKPTLFKHINCRNNIYPRSNVARFQVPDELVFWTSMFPTYDPPNYTAPHVNQQAWADPDISEKNFKPFWNNIDGSINRKTYSIENYEIKDKYPMNPCGRTGLIGRGLLGRWGPNHAADPIVTRWKRNDNDDIIVNETSSKKILQMVAIQRHDNKMWAIPGGMVDPGEKVTTTLKREFMEEALDSIAHQKLIEDFFSFGVEIYKGYVDDFRNTDNAWIETEAFNFHDSDGSKVGKLKLSAGDDAGDVKWMDINKNIELHANHAVFVEHVALLLNAHW